MKSRIFLAALILAAALPAPSQTIFSNLYTFSPLNVFATNFDGANPSGALTASPTALYGTTVNGGTSSGTIFTINPDGSGFSNLYFFSGLTYNPLLQTSVNHDGANPVGDLVLSGGNLYGVTQNGGVSGVGVIFSIGVNGSNFTVWHTFPAPTYNPTFTYVTNSDGDAPAAGLILSGNTLYGVAAGGGTGGSGTMFSFNLATLQFSNLYNFTPANNPNTNLDGSFPEGKLALVNGILYGTTYSGGTEATGTIFRIDPTGQNFINLHNFSAPNFSFPLATYTNSDGINPQAGLVSDGVALYGTAYEGTTNGYGTVFRVSLADNTFTNLYNFTYGDDGADIRGGLVLSNNVLYGVAVNGGATGFGTVFQLNTDGTSFQTVHSFANGGLNTAGYETNSDGTDLFSSLTLSGSTLYGLAFNGGINGSGTIFALNPPASAPLLNFQLSVGNLILSWNNPAYVLQSSPTANGTYITIFGAMSPYIVPVVGIAQFFRLRLP